jgi:hypothetical protein
LDRIERARVSALESKPRKKDLERSATLAPGASVAQAHEVNANQEFPGGR